MNNGELIALLQQHPMDMKVTHCDVDFECVDIKGLEVGIFVSRGDGTYRKEYFPECEPWEGEVRETLIRIGRGES